MGRHESAMEVHRTKAQLSRSLLEACFSIQIGYVGVSMVFCAIPSASIPFVYLEVYLNHLLHIRQTDYIRGYFEFWVPSLIFAMGIWSLLRLTRRLRLTREILRSAAGVAILLCPAAIWTCAYVWPYKPVLIESALVLICLWVFLKGPWVVARWVGISAFFAHSLFWYLCPGNRFHALEWGIPGYGGPVGMILDFCSALVWGLYIRELPFWVADVTKAITPKPLARRDW